MSEQKSLPELKYSCETCGRYMDKPCEHWRAWIAKPSPTQPISDYEGWLVQQIELWKRTMQGEAELHNTHAWERSSARVTAYKDSLAMFRACREDK
jgi:predicted amidophosphoribosyltransferase